MRHRSSGWGVRRALQIGGLASALVALAGCSSPAVKDVGDAQYQTTRPGYYVELGDGVDIPTRLFIYRGAAS